ncbi:MAG TPA: SPOR domain-containing protein [Saprospiraceae bacterium]|nr:SPOR domain-containing protein [Saprospiraceae bacterium]
MKSNSLLTYLLYALLATLILSAGYKACQMQKEKKLKAKEEAEWQETLKKLYPEGDSTGGGSTYINRDSAAQANGAKTSAASGVESTTTNSGGGKGTAPAARPSATTTTPPTAGTSAKPAAKGSGTVQGVGSGKWEVRAGTFSQMEGARTRLEEVIRVGYTNAEIRKRSDGKAVVVVMRTNDKNKATQAADQLLRRGVDAGVFVTGK